MTIKQTDDSLSRFFCGLTSDRRKIYETHLGEAWVGNAKSLLKKLPANSVDLVFTSPPYALNEQKAYGNKNGDMYVKWFRPFSIEIFRVLKDSGSFVLNLGGGWQSGLPVRSLYPFKVLFDLCEPDPRRKDGAKFYLSQEFFWFNPAKLPNPAQWVTVERIRVKDAVEYIWWFSKTPYPKANNRTILAPYSKSMKRLLSTGRYNKGLRPSGWQISDDWALNHGGSIPPNLLPPDLVDSPHSSPVNGADDPLNLIVESNTSSNDRYRQRCRENGIRIHPATFPKALPEFFIRYLTEGGDTVVDPFAGSNTTGKAADELKRKWVSIDSHEDYLTASMYRWEQDELIRRHTR